jgi:hypothetical protein
VILCLVDGDPVSLEALTFASRLGDVEALVFDDTDVDGYVTHARRVVHDRLDEYAPEAWARRAPTADTRSSRTSRLGWAFRSRRTSSRPPSTATR